MGAWDIGNFDNDDALDFVIEIEEANSLIPIYDLAVVINTNRADDSEYYIEVDACGQMLAGGEIVARLSGFPVDNLPPSVEALKDNEALTVDTSKVASIISAVQHILAESELSELWEETDEFEAWQSVVNDLLLRLRKIS
ncbi:MAG: DUF4259 domain-containing protein [Chloroflexota bacterium]